MVAETLRTPSKRKRPLSDEHGKSSRKHNERLSKQSLEGKDDQPQNDLSESRRQLKNLFGALEATLLSSRSACSFHSIQRAVSSTARCDFELRNVAEILAVWPDCYQLESVMALVGDSRVPSLSIAWPDQPTVKDSSHRRQQFEKRLAKWEGTQAVLPKLKIHTQMPLNTAKIASIKKTTLPLSSSPTKLSDSTSSPSAKDRQSALLDRIRTKANSKSSEPTSDDLKSATIAALIPSAVSSIKILLASRQKKAMGMTELRDNLSTSLSHRIGPDDIVRLIEVMSNSPQYRAWCKIGQVGNVKIVRFIGGAPSSRQDTL